MKITFTDTERRLLYALVSRLEKPTHSRAFIRTLRKMKNNFRGQSTYSELKRRDASFLLMLSTEALKVPKTKTDPKVREAFQGIQQKILKRFEEVTDEAA